MNSHISFVFVLLLLATALCAPVQAETSFFDRVPDHASAYDAEGVYPQGRRFPFSFFSAAVELAAEAGVTLTGPWYGQPEGRQKMAEQAKTAGIPMIFPLQPRDEAGDAIGLEELSEANVDQAVESVRDQVREVLQSDLNEAVAWWYVQPEELRYWHGHELDYLSRAADAIRETDPQGRPVWMYDPGHRQAASLARTAEHLDIVGKGMYTNYSGQRDSRIWVRWTIEQELEAIEQVNSAAIPIAVPEMFRQPDEEHLALIPRWVRHDVYLSLVTGARGVVVYSLAPRANFDARMSYYEAYARICRELVGEQDLGQVFLFGERRNDLSVAVTDGPAEVELTLKTSKDAQRLMYPSVSHLDVAYGDARYLFLVNSANEPVEVAVAGLPQEPVHVEQPWTWESFSTAEGRFVVSLDELEVRMLQLRSGSR